MSAAVCPDCGAALAEGTTCRAIFDQFLALEFGDPEYGAVHMLTVACYMIQHGQYSDAGLVWMEQRLRDYLEHGISAEQIRRGAAAETGQNRRGWKITRQPGDAPQPRVAWSMTIADAARQAEDPAQYRQAVTQWARIVLQEMQPLLKKAA